MRRVALVAAALVASLAGNAGAAERARFDTRVFAPVGLPGFPAHAYVHPNGKVYEGTYVNPNGDTMQSRVFEYGADGTLLRQWAVPGQVLSSPHGVQVATSDARGRLVLLDRTPARVLVLDPDTAQITQYATVPDLGLCSAGAPAGNCSPARDDAAPFANYAAWGPDGTLYITDYEQAVIFRVPPGGGPATVWLADARLDGGPFGTAGILTAADGKSLFFTQGSSAGGAAGNPLTGRLYQVPILPDGKPGPLRQLWESAPGDLPDGFAIGRSGTFYIANVGLSAQLAVVGPEGMERERFPRTAGSGENGSPVPFDSPSSAALLGTRLIVANQSAVAGDRSHQVLLDVEVGEEGLPELIPPNAGPELVTKAARAALTGTRTRRNGRSVVIKLSRGLPGTPARVRLTGGGRTLGTGTLRGRTLRLTLRPGARLAGRRTIRLVRSDGRFTPTAVTLTTRR